MLEIMTISKNAIEGYTAQLRTTAANIANLEVIGYKRLEVSFQSVFEKTLRQGTPASPITELGGTNPIQLGAGMSIGSVGLDFTQGQLTDSSNPLASSIQGNGLFIVSPDGGETFRYTRNGDFEIRGNNIVTKIGGMQVYGLNDSGGLVPITGVSGSDLSWTSGGRLAHFAVPWDESAGVTNTQYRIALTSFNNLSGLAQASGTTFEETVSSGAAFEPTASGGSYGTISARNLERANVDLTSETIDSLAAQQALNGNLSILRAMNEEITNFINRLG
ncbi:flagellar hook basal-body protein [Candidatus Margulisiibacteriota bacterium]